MSYINILKAGTDHTIWAKGLEFYRDELELMSRRLLDISAKNTSEEASKGVEHFQNQFIIQQKNISDLRHGVKNYVTGLSNDAKEHGGHVNDIFITQGNDLRERYEQLEQIMNSLRHEFNDFLSKWM
jgi:1,4-alpha-glucan branching enzyme